MAVDKGRSAMLRQRFMSNSLQLILRDGSRHPLAFLVDPIRRSWRSRSPSGSEPTVQAGHLTSRHSGETERFALEDSSFNQVSNNVGETQGNTFHKLAFDIGGIPVEERTAQMWERLGELPKGTVGKSRPTSGWTG